MGWDIQSIGKHTLDVSNIKTLAEQLAKAFNINIEYGNELSRSRYDKDHHHIVFFDDFAFQSLGEVCLNADYDWYILRDEYFSAKEIAQHFKNGEIKIAPFKHGYFTPENLQENIEEDIAILQKGGEHFHLSKKKERYELYDIFDVDIMKEVINISVSEPFRWFGFINNFRERPDMYFIDYRNRMAELYQSVGSEESIYFPDQGIAQLILDEMYYRSWDDLVQYIKTQQYYEHYKKDFPHLSEKHKQENIELYESKHEALQIQLSDYFINGFIPFKKSDDIEIVLDDFKDLK